MKKMSAILLSLVMLFALAGTAAADVLWEPIGSSFYDAHREECQYIAREYYANAEGGYLEFFTEPGGDSLGFMKNAQRFFVGQSYTDENGVVWGVAEYTLGEDGSIAPPDFNKTVSSGWFRLDGAVHVYDSQQFIEDNGPFPMLDSDFSELYGTKVLFWTYPGSGELVSDEDGWEIGEYFSAEYVYTDVDGNTWCYVSYYEAMRDCWFCSSDPTNKDLPVHAAAMPDFYPTPTETPESEDGGFDNWTLVIIVVCVVVAIGIALILTLGKKKKPEDAEK